MKNGNNRQTLMAVHLMRNSFRRSQLFRFLAVGVINTAFSYGIYACMLFVGFSYALANLIALVLGILFSFKTQGRFVFNNHSNRFLGRFIISWAIIYLATIAVIGRLVIIGLDAYTSGALALPFSTVLSFWAQKYFVFRPTRQQTRSEDLT
jgi:putative flippase GtrA